MMAYRNISFSQWTIFEFFWLSYSVQQGYRKAKEPPFVKTTSEEADNEMLSFIRSAQSCFSSRPPLNHSVRWNIMIYVNIPPDNQASTAHMRRCTSLADVRGKKTCNRSYEMIDHVIYLRQRSRLCECHRRSGYLHTNTRQSIYLH